MYHYHLCLSLHFPCWGAVVQYMVYTHQTNNYLCVVDFSLHSKICNARVRPRRSDNLQYINNKSSIYLSESV